ncbi:hypothetical protein K491DRAFT_604901 [Lophiostoma macrostomum CBS 122681]|uniref:Tetratricopeptide repeat domain-containing protein n=1 Tax=Lophiostoma macrostomum CBS 122681 TaxID=1314788 RepID=A0A6A6SY34_9PLEO|nr:hypothetical protein K491DRAFT_604901 [Lophiostoma macrostomum CBS 122681]
MATIAAANSLSTNDSWVLNTVFNPENALVQARDLVDDELAPSLPNVTTEQLEAFLATEGEILRSPQQPLLEKAVEQLGQIIAVNPDYASAYCNRAQVLTLLIGDDDHAGQSSTTTTSSPSSDKEPRLVRWADLSNAIRLATPSDANARVSRLHGTVLASAHIQRGKIFWQAAAAARLKQAQKNSGDDPHDLRAVQDMDSEMLEELANREFELAGRYGNEQARTMATLTNPYGRLCGGIGQEAMRADWTVGG